MSLKLYIDHNVHAAIVRGLRERGIDCITALEDEMSQADDEEILKRASFLARIVFTQDADFLAIASDWMARGRDFAGIIYGGQMAISIGSAIRDICLIASIMEPQEMQNWVELIPLK